MAAPRSYRERIDDDPTSPWWADHVARYDFAAERVAGRLVLDIACGSGVGLRVLREAASRPPIGVDIDLDAAAAARAVSGSDQLLLADGTLLPFADDTFGMVTSYETIEHVDEDRRFLADLARVTRPDGEVLLSTPNALVTRPRDGVPRNPFHVREYEPAELLERLHEAFRSVTLLGQHPSGGHRHCELWGPTPGLRAGVRRLTTKGVIRLPAAALRLAARARSRPLFPGRADFTFDEDLTGAHVLLAVCRP